MSKSIFVGSGSTAKNQAARVADYLDSQGHTALRWWEQFTPGQTLLGELDRIAGKVDGALLVFAPEIVATIRSGPVQLPNQNVLFELGYFYGKLGSRRTALIRYGTYYMPSDLRGYIHVTGSRSFNRNKYVVVGRRTKGELDRWVAQV